MLILAAPYPCYIILIINELNPLADPSLRTQAPLYFNDHFCVWDVWMWRTTQTSNQHFKQGTLLLTFIFKAADFNSIRTDKHLKGSVLMSQGKVNPAVLEQCRDWEDIKLCHEKNIKNTQNQCWKRDECVATEPPVLSRGGDPMIILEMGKRCLEEKEKGRTSCPVHN